VTFHEKYELFKVFITNLCTAHTISSKNILFFSFFFLMFFNHQGIYLNKLGHFMSITTLSPYYSKKKKKIINCRKVIVNINKNEKNNLRKVTIHHLTQQ
jgi:hypothetical protein